MPVKNKKSPVNGAKYIKQKNLIKNTAKEQPLNTLRFEDNYFDIMRNNWLIEKYILCNGLYDSDLYENTLTSIKGAIKSKCPTTLTTQLTADGEVVLYKESTLARLNGNGYISNTNYADLLDLTYVGTDNEKIVTLTQVLDEIKGKIPVIIEVINTNSNLHEVEEKLLPILENYMTTNNLNEGVAIMSVNPFTLQWFASHAPHFPRILKSYKFKSKMYGNMKTKELRKLKYHTEAQADYIAYYAKNLPCKHIRKTNPVAVLAYRVQTQDEYKKVAKYCDNIIYTGFKPEI